MREILGLVFLGAIYALGFGLTHYGDKLCVFIVKHTGGTDG